MRIYGPNGTTLGTSTSSTRKTSSGGFKLPDAGTTQETRATLAPKQTANIDALLALQGIEEDPAERRKRSVQRGKRALDVLDDLKLALLSGKLDTRMALRLRDDVVSEPDRREANQASAPAVEDGLYLVPRVIE